MRVSTFIIWEIHRDHVLEVFCCTRCNINFEQCARDKIEGEKPASAFSYQVCSSSWNPLRPLCCRLTSRDRQATISFYSKAQFYNWIEELQAHTCIGSTNRSVLIFCLYISYGSENKFLGKITLQLVKNIVIRIDLRYFVCVLAQIVFEIGLKTRVIYLTMQ